MTAHEQQDERIVGIHIALEIGLRCDGFRFHRHRGFAVAARSWWVGAILVVMFFAIYVPVIRSEERFLRERFPEFEEYSGRVPPMFPRITPYRSADTDGGFSFELYLKHREWNALLGAAAIVGVLILKMNLITW